MFVILLIGNGECMGIDDLKELEQQITDLEKKRINAAHWADLTLSEIELIDDAKKRKEYRKRINEFHVRIINTFSSLVPRNFSFSVSNHKLTYRTMTTDYMNYFYSKGMSREEIVKMLSSSKITMENGEKQK